MIERIISGGQTGADQGAWRAAKAAGIAVGGWMPKGFLTEAGPRPEFAELYGARELDAGCPPTLAGQYRERTRRNMANAQALLWFGDDSSPGGRLTIGCCHAEDKPLDRVFLTDPDMPLPVDVAAWIRGIEPAPYGSPIKVLNVAGNRESKAPGIGAWVERYLSEVFRLLREAGEPVVPGRPPAPSPSASPVAPPHPEDDEERS
jgi:hypothetical protein